MKGLAYTYYRVKYILKVEKKNIMWACILTVVFALFCVAVVTKTYSEQIQSGIAQKVIRFHVRANSDAESDQTLKLFVRDAILKELGEDLEKCHTKQQTELFLKNNFEKIKKVALQEIHQRGYDYNVKVYLEKTAFPLKKYGNLSFPAGIYDALCVEIGKGEGQNWWCVVYPPLCYVDVAYSEVTEQSKEKLQSSLTEEEYCIVDSTEQGVSAHVKFKIVEWWQERENH